MKRIEKGRLRWLRMRAVSSRSTTPVPLSSAPGAGCSRQSQATRPSPMRAMSERTGEGADGVVVGADDPVPGLRVGAAQLADDVVHQGVPGLDPEGVEPDGLLPQDRGQLLLQEGGAGEGLGPAGVPGADVAGHGPGGRVEEDQPVQVGPHARRVDLLEEAAHLARRRPLRRARRGPRRPAPRRRGVALGQGVEEVLDIEGFGQPLRWQPVQGPAARVPVDGGDGRARRPGVHVVGEVVGLSRTGSIGEEHPGSEGGQIRGSGVDEGDPRGDVAQRRHPRQFLQLAEGVPLDAGQRRPGQRGRGAQQPEKEALEEPGHGRRERQPKPQPPETAAAAGSWRTMRATASTVSQICRARATPPMTRLGTLPLP